MKKLVFIQMVILALLASLSFAGNNPDKKEVRKAFDLRMAGKVDEAKAMLESVLVKDSTNAMALYEMARLNHYMMIGKGEINVMDILKPINKAVAIDPENVTYAYYNAIASFMNAFFAMQTGQEGEVKNRLSETCSQFDKVLSLKPDYCEAMLYLVEIYGLLPADMGGDSAKALIYQEKLLSMNGYFGAKAKAVLAPEGTDLVKFWDDLSKANAGNPDYLAEAGKACLFIEDPGKAEQYFNEAVKLDPSKNIHILDLARYHMMMVMQNGELASAELPVAKTYLEKYLKSEPEPVVPLKAYTMGLMARIEMFLGNQAEADRLMQETNALDPYFSKASGIPTLLLFDPPDQVSHQYFSFFSPF